MSQKNSAITKHILFYILNSSLMLQFSYFYKLKQCFYQQVGMVMKITIERSKKHFFIGVWYQSKSGHLDVSTIHMWRSYYFKGYIFFDKSKVYDLGIFVWPHATLWL